MSEIDCDHFQKSRLEINLGIRVTVKWFPRFLCRM